MDFPLFAHDIAKQRLESYVSEKVKGHSHTAEWEFYTFLLKKAKEYTINTSSMTFSLPAYLEDEKEVNEIFKKACPSYVPISEPETLQNDSSCHPDQ